MPFHKEFLGIDCAALRCCSHSVDAGNESGDVEGGCLRAGLDMRRRTACDVVEVYCRHSLARHNLHPVAGGVGTQGETALGVGSRYGHRHGVVDEHRREQAVAGDLHKAGIRGLAVVPPPEMAHAAGGDGVEHGALALHVDTGSGDMAPVVVVAGDRDGVSAPCSHSVLTPR